MTSFRLTVVRSAGRWRANSSKLRTIFAIRSAWATISSIGRNTAVGTSRASRSWP